MNQWVEYKRFYLTCCSEACGDGGFNDKTINITGILQVKEKHTMSEKTTNEKKEQEKAPKGYYFQVLLKGKFKKESFIEEKLSGLDGDTVEIVKEALAAYESGGIVYAAYFNKDIAKIYIFTASGTKKETVLEMTGEYINNNVLTPEIDSAFETEVKAELINKSDSYFILIFKDFIINKGDYKTQYSIYGMLLGFALGFICWGVLMHDMMMGVSLGICFGVCYAMIFAKHIKVEKTEPENKTETKEEKAEKEIETE